MSIHQINNNIIWFVLIQNIPIKTLAYRIIVKHYIPFGIQYTILYSVNVVIEKGHDV